MAVTGIVAPPEGGVEPVRGDYRCAVVQPEPGVSHGERSHVERRVLGAYCELSMKRYRFSYFSRPVSTPAGHKVKSGKAMRLVAISGVTALGLMFGRRWQLTWGANALESHSRLPGDDLIDRVDLTATRAISIQCSADHVWPWVAQIGQGRGGMYSYDALENLVGCDIHSADRIVPDWQDVVVGDSVRLAPEVSLAVAAVERGHALVLSGGVHVGNSAPPYDFTWSFVILDGPDGSVRLLVRERYCYRRVWARLLVEPIEVVSFVMSQKMLRGIRDRAESAAKEDHGQP